MVQKNRVDGAGKREFMVRENKIYGAGFSFYSRALWYLNQSWGLKAGFMVRDFILHHQSCYPAP